MPRVTAYCRVSTDNDDQLNSLANQEKYFRDYIESNPDWEYVPLYVDEGTSGTSTKKRKMFNRMVNDAKMGLFDLILTKEVSRFARNTVDTLHFTRELKELGIGVIFITDNIDSRDPDGEFRLTIMAAMAQDESRRTSQRVKWGQERSMEKGVVFGQKILGYDRKEGKLTINPSEADTIRLIFHKYIEETKGLTTIAKELEQAGILTSYGRSRWEASAILRILKNEKYCGDLKQKKFLTPNYLTHQTKRNKGEERFIIVKDNHEPIIRREIFEKVQSEISRRGSMNKNGTKHTRRYAFSGKLQCGLCGATLVNRNNKSADGKREYRRWRCCTSMKYGSKKNNDKGCYSETVRNDILEYVFLHALHDMVDNKDEIIKECVYVISCVLDNNQKSDYGDLQKELERISSRIDILINLRLDGEITKEELQSNREPLDKQMTIIKEKLNLLDSNTAMVSKREAFLSDIESHISAIAYTEVFSEDVAREVLEKIIIHDKNNYDVYFNGSVSKSCHYYQPVP